MEASSPIRTSSNSPQAPSAPQPQHEGDKVLFFHALKTGGVTVRRLLGSLLGHSFHICYDPTIEAVEALIARSKAVEFHSFQYQGALADMHGQIVKLGRWDILTRARCFTMLRDPVDQVVSLYFHVLRRRIYTEPVYRARGIPFPETLEQFVASGYNLNLQTGFLASHYQTSEADAIGPAELERAREFLVRGGVHVGLTGRFADSMNILKTITGLHLPEMHIPIENRGPDRIPLEAVPLRMRNIIRERSAFDAELYRFGRELFLEDLARCGPTPAYVFLEPPAQPQVAPRNLESTPRNPESALRAAGSPQPTSEQQRPSRPRTVFFHIMKTGGMTFRHILQGIYGPAFHEIDNPGLESIQQALATYDCIEFHTLPFAGDYVHMHRELVRQERWELLAGADVFTMLREPVDQVVSQFYYMQQKRHLIEPAYLQNGRPFPETIDQYLDDPIHLNNQLAFLAGKYRLQPGNPLDYSDLNLVRTMMLELDMHPGLTERFTESMHIFETVTGCKVPGGEIRNQNRNANRPAVAEIPHKLRDRIRDLSNFDTELYEFSRDLFMRDVAACGKTRQYTFL